MPRACTVKGMLLKCVKSWLYSCSFNVHKKSWNPSVKLACGAWTSCSLSGTNIWHICACLPFVRFLSWSLWSPSWNIDVGRLFFFFLFIYRRWPHFFRTVCKEEICAEALTDLQCRPNFCSRVSACRSFGFFFLFLFRSIPFSIPQHTFTAWFFLFALYFLFFWRRLVSYRCRDFCIALFSPW